MKTKKNAKAVPKAAGRVHPMTLGVVRYKFLAVAEEVVEMMVRTCFSPLLNQSRDFSADFRRFHNSDEALMQRARYSHLDGGFTRLSR